MEQNYKYMVATRCFTYNHAPYIEDALRGFAMQETTFPVVNCIVDDASTDGEQEVLKKWAEEKLLVEEGTSLWTDLPYGKLAVAPLKDKHKLTFVILLLAENYHSQHKPKVPLIADWMNNAKYHTLCEGDDYWLDSYKLQKQVEIMEAHPEYSLCFHNAVVMYEDISRPSRIFCSIETSREVSLEEIVKAWIIPTASIMYRRELLPIPEWPQGIISGDMKLSLTAADRGKLYYLKDVMSYYRLTYNTSSSTSRFKEKGEYVSYQKYRLLDFYNQNTDGRHEVVLKKYIKYWKDYSHFYSIKRKSVFLAFMMMPIFSLKKIYWRLFNNQPFS